MIEVKRFASVNAADWNDFVRKSKNGMFMFERDYMDYHSDRFLDHSLLFYKEGELVLLLPANEYQNTLFSHGGLTYGGLIISRKASIILVMEAFNCMTDYLYRSGIRSLVYKAIPHIFHKLPAQDDLYALFRKNASVYRRDASSVIDLGHKTSYTKGTKSNLSKARKNGLAITESSDWGLFMTIEEEILRKKYNTKPTHSATELELLTSKFPENIKLYLVYKDSLCLGGTVIYITDQVVHTQYIGITDEGKAVGALDFLTDSLIGLFRDSKKYFSFGISTEQNGIYLNEGLIRNKESFGARTIVNDFYAIDLD